MKGISDQINKRGSHSDPSSIISKRFQQDEADRKVACSCEIETFAPSSQEDECESNPSTIPTNPQPPTPPTNPQPPTVPNPSPGGGTPTEDPCECTKNHDISKNGIDFIKVYEGYAGKKRENVLR